MENADLKSDRAQQRQRQRRRSIVVASIVGGTLLLLTMGVFAVASQSRDVAAESSRVHALDQMLQSATVARAQLGFGIVLADLNGLSSIDASDAIASANSDAAESVESMLATRALIDADLGGLDEQTNLAVTRFAETVVELQGSENVISEQTDLLSDFETAYVVAQEGLSLQRDAAIEGVRNADNTLGRLGTLVTFLLAFVIPTVAVSIHHLLTRPQKVQLEAEARAVKATVLSRLRRDLVLKRLGELSESVDALPQSEIAGPTPSDQLRNLTRVLLTLERSASCVFSTLDANALLETLARRANMSGTAPRVRTGASEQLPVWSDERVLDLTLDSIIADCRTRGASTVGLSGTIVGDRAELRLTHDGELRSPTALQLVTEQATVTDRLALLGGDDTDLLAAFHLLEDLGGSLAIENSGGRQVFVVSLPRSTAEVPVPDAAATVGA